MGLAKRSSFAAVALALAEAAHLPDLARYSFSDYLSAFGKSYSPHEHPERAAVFAERVKQIQAHNEGYRSGQHTWYAAVNNFTDWTEEEFRRVKQKMGHGVAQHPMVQLPHGPPNPERVDWREKNVVTPVKNQGGCGSCWAFSATEALESHHAIATGKLLNLSPQTFVNCVKNPEGCGGTGGCEGATMELAFNLTASKGLALESDVPYKGHDETCAPYKAAVTATGYVKLPANDAAALETALATKGPVSVTVAANWMLYGGGIFSSNCSGGCALDHGVVAIGYDKSASGSYWLVRNSWGESWGEKGYIRLARANDDTTYTDVHPEQGVACKPYPKTQTVGGESGILFDTSYPTGVTTVNNVVVV